MSAKQTPFVPAQAGIQGQKESLQYFALGPRLREDERIRDRA